MESRFIPTVTVVVAAGLDTGSYAGVADVITSSRISVSFSAVYAQNTETERENETRSVRSADSGLQSHPLPLAERNISKLCSS